MAGTSKIRYVAFLRAINVGGRNVVTMSALKRPFERLGFDDVDTFIASGNVLFSTSSRATSRLEKRIEDALKAALGYEVATFVRAADEIQALAGYKPFSEATMQQALALNVGFVAVPLSPASRAALLALTTESDTFHVNGREIYWMCLKKQSDSKMSNAVLERALTMRSTFRGMKTIVRLAAKLGDGRAGGAR